MKFFPRDIADYYNQTQIHYEKWWKLEENASMHFGLWFEGTKSFNTALENTNREMAKMAGIVSPLKVLDAGCGVGGTAFFLAETAGCVVEGITLSEKQLATAQKLCEQKKLDGRVRFSLQDFNKTSFSDNSFDVVWACESSCHAPDKKVFFQECFRILKPGGILVVADYIRTTKGLHDHKRYLKRWADLWAIEQFYDWAGISEACTASGLRLQNRVEFTREIWPSSKRMSKAAWLGSIASEFYNLFHNTSRFAKHHYRAAIYQHKALKHGDWEYWIFTLQKPFNNP